VTQAQQKPDAWDRVIRPWWTKILIGSIMIFMAVVSYNDFSKLESGERESLFVGQSTKVLYDIGGEGLAAGVPMLVGMAMLAWGGYQVLKGEK
jgi:hypothetical protein